MEPVEHQQAADQLVAGQLAQERPAGLAGLSQTLAHASEAHPVQVENGLDQLLGAGPRGGVGRLLDRLDQRLDPLDSLSKCAVTGRIHGHPLIVNSRFLSRVGETHQ